MQLAKNREVDQDPDAEEAPSSSTVPKYGSKPNKPGLYLGLFHGRRDAREAMNEWGFDGPTIGPLRWCHTTYAFDIKIEFEDASGAVVYFGFQGALQPSASGHNPGK